MSEKHTPGRWAVNDFGEIIASNGFVIATLAPVRARGAEGRESHEYRHGNGALLAAAPELQAKADAYKWAYEYLQSRMESIDRPGWAHDCDGEIQDRIAAATREVE